VLEPVGKVQILAWVIILPGEHEEDVMGIILRNSVDAIFIEDSSTRRVKEISMADRNSYRVRVGDIYELQIAENSAKSEASVASRAYSLGFIEIDVSGVVEKDNRVWVGNTLVGYVVGFANLNSPHRAIVISSDKHNSIFDIHSMSNKRISIDSTSFIVDR